MLTRNFANLPILNLKKQLISTQFYLSLSEISSITAQLEHHSWEHLKREWQRIHNKYHKGKNKYSNYSSSSSEQFIESNEVDWLITVFNKAFASYSVTLVRGETEPEYFPPCKTQPAKIQFAHGFFRSALHEISHWSIAGSHRRTLSDFGYWYAPDGRNKTQQYEFERVEIKPQAIECLFTLACHKSFQVSQDNLNAKFDTSQSTFEKDVYEQALTYIDQPNKLPTDAKRLLTLLFYLCDDETKN